MGDDGLISYFTPPPHNTRSGYSTVSNIVAGFGLTCGIMASGGGVKCWINNNCGQLGIGSTGQRNSPTDQPGAARVGRGVVVVVGARACVRWRERGGRQVKDNTLVQNGFNSYKRDLLASDLRMNGIARDSEVTWRLGSHVTPGPGGSSSIPACMARHVTGERVPRSCMHA
jgi:hypothetical protein